MSRAASITNPTASPWNINEAAQSFNERFKSVIGLHDDGSGQRPPWMEKSGLWADTLADGKTINIWQYDGVRDILLWSVDVENGVTRIDQIQAAAAAAQPLGDIRLLPFRNSELPFGWYLCNGDRYPLGSPQGRALYDLYGEESGPSNYALDWGIIIDADNAINLPNMFHADGRGYFLRAGTTPGLAVDDQMRPITGRIYDNNRIVGFGASGAFYTTGWGNYVSGSSSGGGNKDIILDTGRLGPNFSGTETHPLERHATPAIYLGV